MDVVPVVGARAYGKEGDGSFAQWMRDGRAISVHQKKSRAWFQSRGLQLPKEGSKRGIPNLLSEADIGWLMVDR